MAWRWHLWDTDPVHDPTWRRAAVLSVLHSYSDLDAGQIWERMGFGHIPPLFLLDDLMALDTQGLITSRMAAPLPFHIGTGSRRRMYRAADVPPPDVDDDLPAVQVGEENTG